MKKSAGRSLNITVSIAIIIAAIILFSGCRSHDDLDTKPNYPEYTTRVSIHCYHTWAVQNGFGSSDEYTKVLTVNSGQSTVFENGSFTFTLTDPDTIKVVLSEELNMIASYIRKNSYIDTDDIESGFNIERDRTLFLTSDSRDAWQHYDITFIDDYDPETGSPYPAPEPLNDTKKVNTEYFLDHCFNYYGCYLLENDCIIRTTDYDLDGDGVEEQLSTIYTCDVPNESYKAVFDVNGHCLPYPDGSFEARFFDFDPDDQFTEVLLFNGRYVYDDNTDRMIWDCYLFRYTGSELIQLAALYDDEYADFNDDTIRELLKQSMVSSSSDTMADTNVTG